MTLNVKWRTGVGYGDFVTGLGYAHSATIKYRVPVSIEFYWNHSRDFLFSHNDPESIVDRCDYIYSIMRYSPMVEVKHKFNTKADFRFYNQLDEFNPLHGLWYTDLPMLTKPKHIAIWTTENNVEFPGILKDPAYRHWNEIREKFNDYVIEEITYRTPVKTAIEIIQRCEFGIGYDGLAHQLFKFMWKPLFVLCRRKSLNNILIPQAVLFDNPVTFLKADNEIIINEAKQKVIRVRKQHEQYLNDKAIASKHKLFNTFIY